MRRIFVTDCEGPISKNDNAFELAQKLIPEGARLFTLISKYDDIQAEIVRRPGYRPGDTLKLIIPFLKAYGATNDILRRLSAEDMILVKGAKDTLYLIRRHMPSFIVSTSYEHYIQPLCKLIDFPEDHTYCTKLDIDRFKIPDWESECLRNWTGKLVRLSPPNIPASANSISDLSREDRENIAVLDKIFWEEMQRMTVGNILKVVRPIGGIEKVESVRDIVNKHDSDMGKIIYFGDSITDSEPLKYVRNHGGVAVSFNGNEYAVREAELAILSDHTLVTGVFALAFNKGGIDAVRNLVTDWNYENILQIINGELRPKLQDAYKNKLPHVEIVSESNKKRLIEESCAFRKKVRGEIVGSLG